MKTTDAVDFQPPDSLPAWRELPQHMPAARSPGWSKTRHPQLRGPLGRGARVGAGAARLALARRAAGLRSGSSPTMSLEMWLLWVERARVEHLCPLCGVAVSAAHTPRLLRRARSLRGLSDGQLLLWCAASPPRLHSPPLPRLRRLCGSGATTARHHPRTVRHTRHRIDAPRRAAHTRTRAPAALPRGHAPRARVEALTCAPARSAGTPPRTHLSSAPSWTRWTASWSSSACLGGAVAPELGSSCPIGVPLQPRAPSTERGGGGRLPHPLRAMLPRRVPAVRGRAGAADRPRGLWRAARRRRLAGRAAARDRGEPRAVPRLQPADAVAVALHRPVQQAGREGSERAAGAAAAGLADVRL